MSPIDELIRSALSTFADDALEGPWNGRREREAVGLFAFGYLLQQVRVDGPLVDPAQIALEVPIPQVIVGDEDGRNKKIKCAKIWSSGLIHG